MNIWELQLTEMEPKYIRESSKKHTTQWQRNLVDNRKEQEKNEGYRNGCNVTSNKIITKRRNQK